MTSPIDTILIGPGFFGYVLEMKRCLERRGRSVALFEDRPARDNFTKGLIRVLPRIMVAKAESYFAGITAQLAGQPVRDVLVIKGEALSPDAIRRMRAAFPEARFTLYFWDSFRNMPPDTDRKAALFDRVLTFDPVDAAVRGIAYQPLFFIEQNLPKVEQDIDVLFFGSVHGDRHAVMRRVAKVLPRSLCFVKFLYVQARWLFAVRVFGDASLLLADPRDFIFTPKNRKEMTLLMARSRVVLDIERPVQSGYTIRTLETLGAGRKLITTNAQVGNADFYNPANIAIIDRRRPIVSEAFFDTPYAPVKSEIIKRYSLDGWMDDVLPQTR